MRDVRPGVQAPKQWQLRAMQSFIAPSLGDALADPRKMPWRLGPHETWRCALEGKLRTDARMLASVAPWALTARLVTR